MASNKAGLPVGSFAAHNDTTPVVAVGTVHEDKSTGKVYKYVLVEDANVAYGDVVEYSDTTGTEVTKDRAGGSSIGRVVAGVVVSTAITDAKYGWIQTAGLCSYVKTDGGVVAGDALVPHASTDGVADTATASSTATNTEGQVFGYALNTDTATTTTNSIAMLRCAY